MKSSFLFVILILNSIFGYSQTNSDSIQIQQRLGKVYLQHGKLLSTNELHNLLEKNDSAYIEVKKAKENIAPMYLFSFAGGFLIGWPLGTALGGGKPQWGLAGGGLLLVLCAIPFQIGYNKHIGNAVMIYNSKLKKIGVEKKVAEIGFSKTSFGLEIKF